MGLSKHYDELKELLDEQICKILKKGDITPTELDSLYKASAIMLDMETEKAMKQGANHEEINYSQRMGNSNHYPWWMYQNNNDMSYRGNSYNTYAQESNGHYNSAYNGAYDGAYDGSIDSEYSGRRGRSARTGRYVSRSSERDRMIEKLEDMMENATTDKARRALQQCVDKLEQQ